MYTVFCGIIELYKNPQIPKNLKESKMNVKVKTPKTMQVEKAEVAQDKL